VTCRKVENTQIFVPTLLHGIQVTSTSGSDCHNVELGFADNIERFRHFSLDRHRRHNVAQGDQDRQTPR
jgi:hypothetical protein